MVAAAVAKFMIGLGLLGALAGVITGALFVLSDEFVIARIQCSTAQNPLANASNCNSDNFVLSNDGSGNECQIGKLGLFQSEFTPDCADATPYEINEFVDAFNGDPVNFGPLFPAQNNLANTLQDLTGATQEFVSCTQFFSAPLVQQNAMVAASVAGIDAQLDPIRQTIKATFDGGVDDLVNGLDGLFAGAHISLVDLVNATFNFPGGPGPLPPFITDPYFTGTSLAAGMLDVNATAPFALLHDLALAVAGAIQLGVGNAGGALDTLTVIQHGLAVGTEFAPGVITGVSALGLWDALDSTILCGSLGTASCTYLDFVLFTNLTATTSRSLIESAAAAVIDYESNALSDPISIGAGITSRAAIEGLVALVRANAATPDQALAVSLGFDKNAFETNLKNNLPFDATIPDNFFLPAFTQSGEAYAVVCAGIGLAPTCSFFELMVQIQAGTPTNDPLKPGIDLVVGLLSQCDLAEANTTATCFSLFTQANLTGGTNLVIDQAAQQVLGGLYGGFPDGLDINAYFGLAIAACEDDEKDIAAIEQAQLLTPAGIGIVGAGLVIAIINLVLCAGTSMGRWLGVLAGIVTLAGVVLVLVALLGVYNAPIYASIGGSGVEDGSNFFSSGIALIYALVAIAGGAVGGLLILIGSLLSKPDEDASVAIMKP